MAVGSPAPAAVRWGWRYGRGRVEVVVVEGSAEGLDTLEEKESNKREI